jgi:hypothetical protein
VAGSANAYECRERIAGSRPDAHNICGQRLDVGLSLRNMQDAATRPTPRPSAVPARPRHALNRHTTYSTAHQLGTGN